MKNSSTRLIFTLMIVAQAALLSSCETMGDMFDNRTHPVMYTDAYSPNGAVNLNENTPTKRVNSSQKVSSKEITQTATPAVTGAAHNTQSSQVPLNAPTVE